MSGAKLTFKNRDEETLWIKVVVALEECDTGPPGVDNMITRADNIVKEYRARQTVKDPYR
jgi:hypothetical protein